MKKSLLLFYLLASFTCLAQEWELKKDKNEIKIYTRSISYSKIKEYKAVMTVNTTLKQAFNVIMDAENLWKWNYKTENSRILKKVSETSQIIWIKNNLPWPVLNRDHISLVKVVEHTSSKIKITLTPDITVYHPKEKHTIRVANFNGYWLLEKTKQGIRITQQLFGDPGGNMPSWLLNSLITTAPYHSFANLKDILEN
jgi:hypothetical protein